MLEEALMGSRMFAVIMAADNEKPVASGVAGLGYVRTGVQNEDGTTNILLQGYGRVVFEHYSQISPYYKGKPEWLELKHEAQKHDVTLAQHLVRRIFELKIPKQSLKDDVKDFLQNIEDYHMLADIIAGSLVQDPLNRQRLLEMTGVSERLLFLVNSLHEEYSS